MAEYIKEPLVRPLVPIRTKVSRDLEFKTLSKYSTFRILMHLYRKHQLGLAQLFAVGAMLWGILSNFYK